MNNLSLLCDSKCELGEGPLWVEEEESIYWVDIIAQALHRISLDGTAHEKWYFDSEISSINRRINGGFIATFREGFAFIDLPSGKVTPIESPESEIVNNRFNDAKIDSDGNLWAGTMDDDEQLKSGALYVLLKNLEWRIVDDGYCITNGPAFARDGNSVYHADTLSRVIYRLLFDSEHTLIAKEVFIELSEQDGYPDGMTIDTDECLWVCHFSGAKVTKYSSEGVRKEEFQMPVSNVTSCTFVGKKLNKIVFTTARKGLTKEQLLNEPDAGGLFIADANCTGIEVSPFYG